MNTEAIPFAPLAQFASSVYRNPLPADIGKRIRTMLLDQIGLQIGCSALQPRRRSVNVYRKFAAGTPGNSTVVGSRDKTNAEFAAFMNATFGHSEGFDDVCLVTQAHPGAVVVPTAIAMAEEVNANGRQLLRAIAAGVEVMLRVARLVPPDRPGAERNTTQRAGSYGAAIAAGLLLGMEETRLVRAMQAAGNFASGLVEYDEPGGSEQAIHAAIAAAAGVRAAALAFNGLAGAYVTPEGGRDAPRGAAEDFHRFLIGDVALKHYNCGCFIDAALEATLDIVGAVGLEVGNIDCISVGLSRRGMESANDVAHPHEAAQVRRSAQFCIALALLAGAPRLGSYSPERLQSPAIWSLADKVELYPDAHATDDYPDNHGAVVTVTVPKVDDFIHRVRHPKGSWQNPMTDSEVFGKLYFNTIDQMSDEQINELYHAVNRIEGFGRVSALTRRMTERKPEASRREKAVAMAG